MVCIAYMCGVGLQKSYCYIILEHIINDGQVVNMRSIAIHDENIVLVIIKQPQSSQMCKEHSSPIVEFTYPFHVVWTLKYGGLILL